MHTTTTTAGSIQFCNLLPQIRHVVSLGGFGRICASARHDHSYHYKYVCTYKLWHDKDLFNELYIIDWNYLRCVRLVKWQFNHL